MCHGRVGWDQKGFDPPPYWKENQDKNQTQREENIKQHKKGKEVTATEVLGASVTGVDSISVLGGTSSSSYDGQVGRCNAGPSSEMATAKALKMMES